GRPAADSIQPRKIAAASEPQREISSKAAPDRHNLVPVDVRWVEVKRLDQRNDKVLHELQSRLVCRVWSGWEQCLVEKQRFSRLVDDLAGRITQADQVKRDDARLLAVLLGRVEQGTDEVARLFDA